MASNLILPEKPPDDKLAITVNVCLPAFTSPRNGLIIMPSGLVYDSLKVGYNNQIEPRDPAGKGIGRPKGGIIIEAADILSMLNEQSAHEI